MMPRIVTRFAVVGALSLAGLTTPVAAPEAQQAPGAQRAVPSRIEVLPVRTRTLTGDAFLRGGTEGREALIAGELRLPAGIAPDARVPAVVLIHGSGGISGSMDFWVR